VSSIPRAFKSITGITGLVATLFPTAWGVIVSAVIATGLAALTVGVRWVESPLIHSTLFLFGFFLWTFIGLAWITDRKKPQPVSVVHDLSYGITLEFLNANSNPMQELAALQFALGLRNFSTGPIHYNVEKFDVIISNRTLPKLAKGTLGGLMPRGSGKVAANHPFTKDDIKDFFGKEVRGSVDVEITYGQPKAAPVRKLTLSFDVYLNFLPNGLCNSTCTIREESDEDITINS
jgi:preprotein translocase subunit SecG